MIDEHLEEQAALYAFGLLEITELQQFEEALTANAELREVVDDLQKSAATWSLAAPAQNPPAHLKTRVLEAIRAESEPSVPLTTISKTAGVISQKPARTFFGSWTPWALAACLAIVCVALGDNHAALKAKFAGLQEQARSVQTQLASLEERDQLSQKEIAELRHQNVLAQIKISTMTAQIADYEKCVAVVVWDEKKQTGMLKINHMPPPNADKDYQLWVIDPQHKLPVNAGVFKVDSNGVVTCAFEPKAHITSADKFAVSIERKGGVPEHEGPIVLLTSN